MVQKDTQFVMKNNQVQQPFIPTDGLELYYDVKGKKNTDNYKGTLLDMSGKGRHGTLSNFAYEGVSGFTGTTEGGLLLDDVDDKIVRPAISGIEYTSASRNLFITPIGYSTSTVDGETCIVLNNYTLPNTYEADTRYTISARGKYIAGYAVALKIEYTDGTNSQSIWGLTTFSNMSITSKAGKTVSAIKLIQNTSDQGVYSGAWNTIQLEKNSIATPYTPYIPLPIMTYQMNGNILSFEKDGTVKRTTKDANGNEVVVSRKGINLVRNGNFTNLVSGWGTYANLKWFRASEGECTFLPSARFGGIRTVGNLSLRENNIYYISTEMKTSDVESRIFMINGVINESSTAHSGSNEYENMEMIYKHKYPTATILYLSPQTMAYSDFKEISIKNAMIINLTEAYGAGSEPTLAYIQSHPEEFAWTPNPNDLIETVEIKNNLVGDLENLQGNDFEQHEDGVVTYTNEAEEGSVVRVDIDGISDQPLRFRNSTDEQVVITEHDQVDTDAIKKIEFQGNSVQLADKYREVSGTSVMIAPELHDKDVADKLVIGGNTTQYTETSNVVTDGLEMWLSGRNFSNSPATTSWKDLTGVNNGTASGFAFTTASGSDGNGGVVFDGVDDYLSSNFNGNIKNRVTIELIASTKKSTTAHNIIAYLEPAANYISFLGYKPFFSISINGKQELLDSGMVSTANTFYHIVGMFDGNYAKLYVDGVLKSTLNIPNGTLDSITNTTIGRFGNAYYLNGTIKTIRIYNRALTDAEVIQNYNAGLSIPIPNIAMPQEVKHVNSGSKVLVHGKNFCNESNWLSANDIGIFALHGQTGYAKNWKSIVEYIPVLPNTMYTLSFVGINGYIFEYGIDKNYTEPFYASVTNPKTFTTKETTKYIRFTWEDLTVHDIQLELGESATAYVPYQGIETTIPVTLKSIG